MTSKSIDKTNAMFEIVNVQKFKEHEDRLEVITEGRFSSRNGACYLVYKEYSDIGEVSVTVKAKDEQVTVTRSGACKAKLEYIPGEKREILYTLPFGTMVMDLETLEVKNELSSLNGGILEMKYNMIINGESYYNSMKLEVKKDK